MSSLLADHLQKAIGMSRDAFGAVREAVCIKRGYSMRRAVSQVRSFTKNGQIEFIKCDVSNLKSAPLPILARSTASACTYAKSS